MNFKIFFFYFNFYFIFGTPIRKKYKSNFKSMKRFSTKDLCMHSFKTRFSLVGQSRI